jgi:branched-chain amino acid transport system ATP-binding protein
VQPLLDLTGVRKSFGGLEVIGNLDLTVGEREIVSLIGPNGAGKTTLVNCITGFDLPDSGSVVVEGSDVTSWKAARRARAGIARSFQQGHLFGGLSVRENVEVAAIGVGASAGEARRRAETILALLELVPQSEEPAGRLPHGLAMKLGVARALATEPRYMLLDEPAAGLSDSELPAFVRVLRSLAEDHEAGVLVIDHNMALIMEVCDRLCVLDEGRLIAEGTPEEIRQSADVAAAYLGGTGAAGD